MLSSEAYARCSGKYTAAIQVKFPGMQNSCLDQDCGKSGLTHILYITVSSCMPAADAAVQIVQFLEAPFLASLV